MTRAVLSWSSNHWNPVWVQCNSAVLWACFSHPHLSAFHTSFFFPPSPFKTQNPPTPIRRQKRKSSAKHDIYGPELKPFNSSPQHAGADVQCTVLVLMQVNAVHSLHNLPLIKYQLYFMSLNSPFTYYLSVCQIITRNLGQSGKWHSIHLFTHKSESLL